MFKFYIISVIISIPISLIFAYEYMDQLGVRKNVVYASALIVAALPIVNMIYMLEAFELFKKWTR